MKHCLWVLVLLCLMLNSLQVGVSLRDRRGVGSLLATRWERRAESPASVQLLARPTLCLLSISSFPVEEQCKNALLKINITGLLGMFMKWNCAHTRAHSHPDTLRGQRQLISAPSSARPPNPALSLLLSSPLSFSPTFFYSSIFHNNYVGPGIKFSSESLLFSVSWGLAHSWTSPFFISTVSKHCTVNLKTVFFIAAQHKSSFLTWFNALTGCWWLSYRCVFPPIFSFSSWTRWLRPTRTHFGPGYRVPLRARPDRGGGVGHIQRMEGMQVRISLWIKNLLLIQMNVCQTELHYSFISCQG